MKTKELEIYVKALNDDGHIRNDGKQNLYFYSDEKGVWIYFPPVEARRNIAIILKRVGLSELTCAELKILQQELSEKYLFYRSGLAETTTQDIIVTRGQRICLKNLEVLEYSPEAYEKIGLDFVFDKDAKLQEDSTFAGFLKGSLGIENIYVSKDKYHPKVRVLLQMTIYLLSNLYGAKKAFILLGEPHTGKSVWIKFLAKLVGDNGYIPLSLADLGDRFRSSLLEHKHLILSHEMRCTGLKHLDIVKAVISGDPIIIEAKGKQAKLFTPKVKILMAANTLPLLAESDVGGAFADRLLVLTFGKSIERKDLNLLENLWRERNNILSLAVKEAPKLIADNLVFCEDEMGQRAVDSYKTEGNAIVDFLAAEYVHDENAKIYLLDFYQSYEKYCFENVVRLCSRREFRQQLAQLGYVIRKSRILGSDNPRACVCGVKAR